MSNVGDTELISIVRRAAAGNASLDEIVAECKDHPSAVNLGDRSGRTPLHVACSLESPARADVLRTLLEQGANPALLDTDGNAPVACSPTDRAREDAVAVFVARREMVRRSIPPVAPLFASRLMKQCSNPRGCAVFSNVAEHCVYYLYNGAVYMWDTTADAEHVIYNPRRRNPSIAKAQGDLASHLKQKSFVANGGADPTYDFADEEILLTRIADLERDIIFVRNFSLATPFTGRCNGGQDATEWLFCDDGTVIGVRMTRKGIGLRAGRGNEAGDLNRRKSYVCGSPAAYPTGKVPDVTVRQSCVLVRAGPTANDSLCAVDAVGGTLVYVLGPPPSPDSPLAHSPAASVRKAISFDRDMAPYAFDSSQAASCVYADTFCDEPRLRIVHLDDMVPKTGFDDAVSDLCRLNTPFANCSLFDMNAHEFPVGVAYLRREVIVAALPSGLHTARIPDAHGEQVPPELQQCTRPSAPVVGMTVSAVNRFCDIAVRCPRTQVAQLSDAVDLFEWTEQTGMVAVARVGPDHVPKNRFFPLFMPQNDTATLVYQALGRQEVNIYDPMTRRGNTICRLPRPSSLRFQAVQQQQDDAPFQLSFTVSRNGEFLLRYNTTVQVMTVYRMEELHESGTSVLGACYTRMPRPVIDPNSREVIQIVEDTDQPPLLQYAVIETQLPHSVADAVVISSASAHNGRRVELRGDDRRGGRLAVVRYPDLLKAMQSAVDVHRKLVRAKWPDDVVDPVVPLERLAVYPGDESAATHLHRGVAASITLCVARSVADAVAAHDTTTKQIGALHVGATAMALAQWRAAAALAPIVCLSPLTSSKVGSVTVFVPYELRARLA